MKLAAASLAASLLLAACGSSSPGYPVPPPLPAESIPLPPVSEEELIWHPADWVYFDGSYRLEPGRYEPRGEHGTVWIRGHWTGTRGSYAWMPGGWS